MVSSFNRFFFLLIASTCNAHILHTKTSLFSQSTNIVDQFDNITNQSLSIMRRRTKKSCKTFHENMKFNPHSTHSLSLWPIKRLISISQKKKKSTKNKAPHKFYWTDNSSRLLASRHLSSSLGIRFLFSIMQWNEKPKRRIKKEKTFRRERRRKIL